jgi:hypothetical protein
LILKQSHFSAYRYVELTLLKLFRDLLIKEVARGKYRADIYIDGIDRQKAQEYTHALRVRGVSLRLIKGLRDESEPLIRLADMRAGCIRGTLFGDKDSKEVFGKAQERRYFKDVTT